MRGQMKIGIIRKIEVQHFVTYDYVEMFPGPSLNMIVGPNGTGKSTIVAAIILGLGGSARTVGRGTRVSEYVKRDCERAIINIYLQGPEESTFIQITREFDKYDQSKWKINGHKCTMADVIKCTKQFNIQVDNLCQFLPQDRVADFAKLNKKELLKETQKALCKEDLIAMQTELVSARQNHIIKLDNVKKLVQKLQETKDANSRLEGKVTNFNKMLNYKEKVSHIERKIEWIIYEEKRTQLEKLRKDKSEAQKILEMYKNDLKQMEKPISDYKKKSNSIQNNDIIVIQKIRDLETSIDETCERIDTVNSKIGQIEDEINMDLSKIEQRNKLIEETLLKLDDMKKQHTTVLNKVAQSQNDKHTASTEITKCTNILKELRTIRDQLDQQLNDENLKIKQTRNKIAHIENIKQARLEQLRKHSEDAYTAVLWLRNNKHQFKGDIFEPIMLELNVLDRNKAKYLESIIPFRDRMAFTCTDKNDMNMLIHCLREEQKLSINVLHSDSTSNRIYHCDIPIEKLRKYGFYTYVNMLFSAPEPIMKYLCQTYKLHNIPVGDASTNSCYEQVPKNLGLFFSDVFRFVINYSKYTGEKSTTQNEVKSDGGFSFVLDYIQLENLRGQLKESEDRIKDIQGKVQNIDAQITKVQEKINVFREKKLEIQKYQQQANTIENSIIMVQKNLQIMRNSNDHPDKVREKGQEKLTHLIREIQALQETMSKQMEQLKESIKANTLNCLKVIWIKDKIDQLENSSSDMKRKLKSAENYYNDILDKYNNFMQEAKTQLQKAKSLSNGYTPADDGFDEFRETFDKLTCDLKELDTDKENLLTKISCLNTADGGEMEKYQNGQKLIEKLTKELKSGHDEVGQIEEEMGRLEKEWLEPLNDLISAINTRFSAAFERMGCVGEVTICKGDDEQNFADYGISIKVSYRSGEPLQELTATVQSGGERAVATAAFMLSLQELTPVPFRCVDEINQGMDSNNERRIFELIVQTTCRPDTSQYFIITPKLVPNLTYPRQMLVHFVHNGPFISNNKNWTSTELCNPQKIKEL